jgi:tetratricopeptide (TPR) repeat protein
MKQKLVIPFSIFFFIGLMTQGFQCGSPEFTGAKVYIQQKNYDKAIENLEIEVQKNPNNDEAWYLLGVLKADKGDYIGMNTAFSNALKLSDKHKSDIISVRGKHWVDHVNAGVTYSQKGSNDSMFFYDKAIDEYQKAIAAWPDTSMTYRYLASAYNNKGDINNAIINLKKAWDLGREKDAYKQAGSLYVKLGMDLKLKFESDNADKLKLQKNMNDIRKGTHKNDIMRAFGAPDSQKKDKKNPKKEEWIYNQYGMTFVVEGELVASKTISKVYDLKIDSTKYYEAVGEFNKAIDIFETIKSTDPKDNENLSLLLQAYVESNRIREATKAFQLAIDNEPDNKLNHYILGVLYRTVHEYEVAIKEFKEAIKIDPEYGDAIFDIGATYYNWGVEMKRVAQEKGDETTEYKQKFQDALPYIEKVTEIKTNDAQIWDTLGTIYALLGQSDKAMKALDKADQIRKGK